MAARFALKAADREAAAIIDDGEWCWPIREVEYAREAAKAARLPGFWIVTPKPRHNV